MVAVSIIVTVSLSSTYSALQLWSLPPSVVRYFRETHFYLMYLWLVPIFWNFFSAMNGGPGYVPLGWIPQKPEDEKFLQYCRVCRGFKPPRSHHCKQCKRCVTKMDHHCPWINNCVGHHNHAAFLRFLFFVPFGCIHGIIVNANFIYRLLDYQFAFYPHYMSISTGWVFFTVTGISFGAGTTLGVLILFITQLRGIMVNKTQIEEWIIEKANHRRRSQRELVPFVHPYHLGCCRNLWEVVNVYGNPLGDGIHWTIRDGCDKYSFTIEQLEQKKLKRERAVTCKVKKSYGGARCPVFSFGISTALCLPCCAEGRIKVNKGDTMIITRWERKWVYGDKKLSKAEVDNGQEVKGWFPRGCIQPLSIQFSESEPLNDSQISDTQVSTHSDSQYSQLSESEPDSGGGSDQKERKTLQRSQNSDSASEDQKRKKRPLKVPDAAERIKRSTQVSPGRSPTRRAVAAKAKRDPSSEAKTSGSPMVTRRRTKK